MHTALQMSLHQPAASMHHHHYHAQLYSTGSPVVSLALNSPAAALGASVNLGPPLALPHNSIGPVHLPLVNNIRPFGNPAQQHLLSHTGTVSALTLVNLTQIRFSRLFRSRLPNLLSLWTVNFSAMGVPQAMT